MESTLYHKPESKITIIFGLISSNQVHELLETNGAKSKESKAIFLIRDSSTYEGLTTVSYYCQEQEIVKHIRFGLTENGWKSAPKPPLEPKLTSTLEVKNKYLVDKAVFDKEMTCFLDTAKKLFEQNVTLEQIKSLNSELQKNEFNLEGLIKPNRTQASQKKHFTHYIIDVFIDAKISSKNTPYEQ